jgi:hypothetical protein
MRALARQFMARGRARCCRKDTGGLNLYCGSRDEVMFRFTVGSSCGKNSGHLSSILLPCFMSCG